MKRATTKPKEPRNRVGSRELVRRSWRNHDKMWIIGCIDAHGAIVARAERDCGTHTAAESKGRRFRFCVWSQDFHATIGGVKDIFNDDEYLAVCDWLIRHGYADDRILPNNSAQP